MSTLRISTTVSSLVLAGVLFFSSYIIYSEAQITPKGEFGGDVIVAFPVCQSAPGVPSGTLTTVGPPNGGLFLYSLATTITYSAGPPRTPGQDLLGRAAPVTAPCIIYVPCPPSPVPCPVLFGTGLPILFHGSSPI